MRRPDVTSTSPPSPLRGFDNGLAHGFSFVEVLFAVMILGIGFIMAAAIFPVAIQQAQTASDESVSASVAWNAFNVIQSKFSEAELPAAGASAPYQTYALPGVVRSFRDPQANGVASLTRGQFTGRLKNPIPKPLEDVVDMGPDNQVTYAQPADFLWKRVKGESVVVDDRRFAWVAFYRRDVATVTGDPAPFAQLIVVVARARESSAYDSRDVTDTLLANLQPRAVRFYLTSDGTGPQVDQRVAFIQGGDAVAEGAYLVVAHDRLPGPGPTPGVPLQGAMNLNVFRIGNHLSGNTWELSPETEFEPVRVGDRIVNGLSGAEGYVIGRTKVGGSYQGVAQDVAVYTMLIPVQ